MAKCVLLTFLWRHLEDELAQNQLLITSGVAQLIRRLLGMVEQQPWPLGIRRAKMLDPFRCSFLTMHIRHFLYFLVPLFNIIFTFACSGLISLC